MTVPQTAAKFAVSRNLIYRWLKQGRIESTVIDGRYVIPQGQTRPDPRRPGRRVKGAA